MIQSAAESIEPDGDGAAALTESYERLRSRVRELVQVSAAELQEFDAAFPRLDVINIPDREHPRKMAMRKLAYAPQAKRAQVLLGQLAGWVSGLIEELELEQRHPPEAGQRGGT